MGDLIVDNKEKPAFTCTLEQFLQVIVSLGGPESMMVCVMDWLNRCVPLSTLVGAEREWALHSKGVAQLSHSVWNVVVWIPSKEDRDKLEESRPQ
jgi:hypothetical protein